jgi:hypothetical protein
MSTANQIERARAAAGAVINLGGDVVGARAGDRATRLAVAEAVVAVAAETARQAAAATQAMVAAAAALRAEMERERELARGSRSPVGRRRQSLSLERRRGRHGRSPVLQMVYRDSGVGTSWPMLTKANYHEWSLLMKVKLQARRLWEVVHVSDIDYDDDCWVLEALCAAVPTELGVSLANKATAKLAWQAIAAAHVGEDHVLRAMLQRLQGEWEGLAFEPGEQAKDFALRLTNLMEQMVCNGDTDLTEEHMVEKFLRCMPKKYAHIVMSIETLLDFEQLTIKDVIGRLKAVQDREEGPHAKSGATGGKLLYTMEQWRAFEKKKEEGSGPSGSSKERRRRPCGGKKEEKGP